MEIELRRIKSGISMGGWVSTKKRWYFSGDLGSDTKKGRDLMKIELRQKKSGV